MDLETALKELNYLDAYGQPLLEMAMSRSAAIDRCETLGIRFIDHFKKIVMEPEAQVVNHWINEMQGWMDSVNRIVLTHNNKVLTTVDKLNWFINATSSPEVLFGNDKNLIDKYEEFTENLINSKWNVSDAITKLLNK